LAVVRECNPRFGFTDPPFRRSLPMTLAFVATASRPTAVLTGPQHPTGNLPGPADPHPAAGIADMVRARAAGFALPPPASLVWARHPAAPAPAGAFRHRRQHHLLTRPPTAESRHAGDPLPKLGVRSRPRVPCRYS